MKPVYLILSTVSLLVGPVASQTFRPEIPRTWAEKDVEQFELPLAQRDRSAKHLSADQYYSLKVRPIYRSYPVYAPGREPAGYIESLKQKDPEITFDASKLVTKQEWIDAGRIVFQAETLYSPATPELIKRLASSNAPIRPDGTYTSFVPFTRYYIRAKGVLEVGINSCAGCHTRVMPDGSLLEGAQGVPNLATNPSIVIERFRNIQADAMKQSAEGAWISYGIPWVTSKADFIAAFTKEQMIRVVTAAYPSVFPRQGTSLTHPPHIPSLIGIQNLRYLDATGLVRHRSIGDLMRYAAVNEGLDTMAHYGDFQPSAHSTGFSGDEGTRYSDEQLYALSLYIYSIQPPRNPNAMDARAKRGEQVFKAQGCAGCHTPPLYTNNMLTPAAGFRVPDDLRNTDAIMDFSVGTDPTLATKTRRGTGFYKVPSLRGVWYRSGFGHAGQADTLEEWFDRARLNSDYVPKGFHIEPGPILGHEFGLRLSATDRDDLIAFLKTL